MLDAMMSILTGGATGLIGTIISGGMKYFENKQKHANELAIGEMEMRMMDKEASIARDIKELDMEGQESQAAWESLRASYKESTSRMSSGDHPALIWVDVVRGMMRPAITLGTLTLMAVIYFTLADGEQQGRIISTILYLGTTCVLWWFGTRNMSKQ